MTTLLKLRPCSFGITLGLAEVGKLITFILNNAQQTYSNNNIIRMILLPKWSWSLKFYSEIDAIIQQIFTVPLWYRQQFHTPSVAWVPSSNAEDIPNKFGSLLICPNWPRGVLWPVTALLSGSSAISAESLKLRPLTGHGDLQFEALTWEAQLWSSWAWHWPSRLSPRAVSHGKPPCLWAYEFIKVIALC